MFFRYFLLKLFSRCKLYQKHPCSWCLVRITLHGSFCTEIRPIKLRYNHFLLIDMNIQLLYTSSENLTHCSFGGVICSQRAGFIGRSDVNPSPFFHHTSVNLEHLPNGSSLTKRHPAYEPQLKYSINLSTSSRTLQLPSNSQRLLPAKHPASTDRSENTGQTRSLTKKCLQNTRTQTPSP